MSRSIEVHIEELVLQGFVGHQAGRIADAVEEEITRLLQERGLPPAFSHHAELGHLNAGTFTLQPGYKAEPVGINIANSVYQTLQNGHAHLPKNGQ